MNRMASFAYAQARLQARHGARPNAATWRRLEGVGDLLHFLQSARTTGLRSWVLHFSARTDIHAMELSLRRQFRQYIADVASWQPVAWRKPILWVQRLLDLPGLQHLLMGERAPGWMRDDPVLKPFATDNLRARREALQDSDFASLVQTWQAGLPLLDGWRRRWRALWPQLSSTAAAPMERLEERLQHHLSHLREGDSAERSRRACEHLAEKLAFEFRRHTYQPAAALIHLALIALDLERLRAALVRRSLFTEHPQGGA
jgi:hypothetical protein